MSFIFRFLLHCCCDTLLSDFAVIDTYKPNNVKRLPYLSLCVKSLSWFPQWLILAWRFQIKSVMYVINRRCTTITLSPNNIRMVMGTGELRTVVVYSTKKLSVKGQYCCPAYVRWQSYGRNCCGCNMCSFKPVITPGSTAKVEFAYIWVCWHQINLDWQVLSFSHSQR